MKADKYGRWLITRQWSIFFKQCISGEGNCWSPQNMVILKQKVCYHGNKKVKHSLDSPQSVHPKLNFYWWYDFRNWKNVKSCSPSMYLFVMFLGSFIFNCFQRSINILKYSIAPGGVCCCTWCSLKSVMWNFVFWSSRICSVKLLLLSKES